MAIHMKLKRGNNEEYEMPLLGLENIALHYKAEDSRGNLSLSFDNDVLCGTASSLSNIIIMLTVCGVVLLLLDF